MKIYDAVVFPTSGRSHYGKVLFSYYLKQKYSKYYFLWIWFKANKEHFEKVSCGGVEVGWGRHVLPHYQAGTIAARLKRWVRVRKRKKAYKRREERRTNLVEWASPTRQQLLCLSPTAFFVLLNISSQLWVNILFAFFLHRLFFHSTFFLRVNMPVIIEN
jgi:hypothetical protein